MSLLLAFTLGLLLFSLLFLRLLLRGRGLLRLLLGLLRALGLARAPPVTLVLLRRRG
jgi:hypothetical protein